MAASKNRVLVRDFEIEMSVGILESEKRALQNVIVNVELNVRPQKDWRADDITNVVSYADVVKIVQDIAAQGHINLLETFAEKIAAACLEDRRVLDARVRAEKPDIIAGAVVGIEIVRAR